MTIGKPEIELTDPTLETQFPQGLVLLGDAVYQVGEFRFLTLDEAGRLKTTAQLKAFNGATWDRLACNALGSYNAIGLPGTQEIGRAHV